MVTTQEGKQFEDDIGAELLETSAKLNWPALVNLIGNLNEEFSKNMRQLLKLRKLVQFH